MSDYGQLTPMVITATGLVTAVGAVILLFTRGTKWEPLQENLGKGARRIGGVATAVAVGLIWATSRNDKDTLSIIAIVTGVGALAFFLAYSIVIGVFSYTKIVGVKKKTEGVKIIGGFVLAEHAKANIKAAPARAGRSITIQEYFEGVQYNPEQVWTRLSLEVARSVFIICYIGMIMCAAIALSSTSLRMALEI